MSTIWVLVLRLLEFQWVQGIGSQGFGYDDFDNFGDDRDGGKVEIAIILVWKRQG